MIGKTGFNQNLGFGTAIVTLRPDNPKIDKAVIKALDERRNNKNDIDYKVTNRTSYDKPTSTAHHYKKILINGIADTYDKKLEIEKNIGNAMEQPPISAHVEYKQEPETTAEKIKKLILDA